MDCDGFSESLLFLKSLIEGKIPAQTVKAFQT